MMKDASSKSLNVITSVVRKFKGNIWTNIRKFASSS